MVVGERELHLVLFIVLSLLHLCWCVYNNNNNSNNNVNTKINTINANTNNNRAVASYVTTVNLLYTSLLILGYLRYLPRLCGRELRSKSSLELKLLLC